MDPHTAVGLLAAEAHPTADSAMVVAATAHPAKFAGAIKEATGAEPELPERLAAVFAKEEHYSTLPNTLSVIQNHVRKFRNRIS